MSEAEPKREIPDQKPFVIRGHHFKMYLALIKEDSFEKRVLSPTEAAKYLRDFIKCMPSGVTISADGAVVDKIPGFLEYSQDVIGKSKESADEFEERIRETFERFISLPDDYPAELTEGIPDTMCEACIVGEHCRSNNIANQVPWYDPSTKESPELDEFLRNLNLFNLPKPTITYDIAHFSNAEPEQIRRIKTTLGIIRKVLKETKTYMWL